MDEEEETEEDRPCAVPWCPLVDEWRFYAEAEELLLGEGNKLHRALLGVTRQTYCGGHVARGLTPQIPRCRAVLQRVATAYRRQKPRTVGLFVSLLKQELEEMERSEFKGKPALAGRAPF